MKRWIVPALALLGLAVPATAQAAPLEHENYSGTDSFDFDDCGFLVHEEVTFNGTLVQTLGLNAELDAAGWSRPELLQWEALMNPKGALGLSSDRIISVLGSGDTLLPFATGLELARAWSLPAENVFELKVGHLTMPVALMRDDRPLRRLREVLT